MEIIPIVAFDTKPIANEIFFHSFTIQEYDGLLLPGGGDIDPQLFHEENKGSRNIDSILDQMQFKLLELFIHANKPVLGICKGLQIINVYFGGTIIQDLPTASTHAWDKEDKIHASSTISDTFISKLYGDTLITNSAHHQGIGSLGKQIFLSQFATDYVVEAIYHATLPIIAVQWHPERMCFEHQRLDTVNGEAIFRYFKKLL
jgi:putative glutamine amidotransferase